MSICQNPAESAVIEHLKLNALRSQKKPFLQCAIVPKVKVCFLKVSSNKGVQAVKGQYTKNNPRDCTLQELSTTQGRKSLHCVITGKIFVWTPLLEETLKTRL